MALRKSKPAGDEEPVSRPPILPQIRFAVITGCICLLIVYVGLLIVPRTSGFRYFVSERYADRLGVPITIESVRMTPGLRLMLGMVRMPVENEFGEAGLVVRHAEVDWSFKDFVLPGRNAIKGIEAENVSLTFVPGSPDRWQPALFADVGEQLVTWLGLDISDFEFDEHAPAPKATKGKKSSKPGKPDGKPGKKLSNWKDVRLHISNGRVLWRGYEGEVLASLSNLSLDVSPARVPNREIRHYLLKVSDARMDTGHVMRNMVFEMISVGDNHILLALHSDQGGVPGVGSLKPPVVSVPAISIDDIPDKGVPESGARKKEGPGQGPGAGSVPGDEERILNSIRTTLEEAVSTE